MNWLERLRVVFGQARSPEERERQRRVTKSISEADPVIREYRKLDVVLKLHVRGK